MEAQGAHHLPQGMEVTVVAEVVDSEVTVVAVVAGVVGVRLVVWAGENAAEGVAWAVVVLVALVLEFAILVVMATVVGWVGTLASVALVLLSLGDGLGEAGAKLVWSLAVVPVEANTFVVLEVPGPLLVMVVVV